MKLNNFTIALLIDAENISAKDFWLHSTYLAPLGRISITRAYADWDKSHPKTWLNMTLTGKVEKRKMHARQKNNSADLTLIREATELIRNRSIDLIIIYSNDGGYAHAIPAWKALNCKVAVFSLPGISQQLLEGADIIISPTTGALEFVSDLNSAESEIISRVRSIELPAPKILGKIDLSSIGRQQHKVERPKLKVIAVFIVSMIQKSGGRILVSRLGEIIRKSYPNFDPSQYQCKKLTVFLRKYFPEIKVLLSSDNITYWAELKN